MGGLIKELAKLAKSGTKAAKVAKAGGSYSAPSKFNKSKVKSRGDAILKMLREGRGDEITDDMFDLGNEVQNTRLDQYLFQNYDLPMDEGSRLKRKAEFDVLDVGHGTRSRGSMDPTHTPDIRMFDASGHGKAGRGIYTDPEPEYPLANEYAGFHPRMAENPQDFELESGAVYPLSVRNGDYLPMEDYRQSWQKLAENDGGYIENLSDARNRASDIAQQEGFMGVLNKEYDLAPELSVFDPRNVRSQFARFDPRLKHLKQLTAMGLLAPEIYDYLQKVEKDGI